MIRVAIETSTWVGSVAVGRDADVLANVELGVRTRHASRAVPALEEALATAGVDRSEIDEVVVGAGPGSFTGVRVAGATAKGLAMALDVPLVAYSSLLALAASAVNTGGSRLDEFDEFDGSDELDVCALFDARRKEAYAGCWRVGPETLTEVVSPMVGSVDAIAAAVAGGRGSAGLVGLVGEGLEKHGAGLLAACEAAGVEARILDPDARPTATALLWLAHHHPSVGRVSDRSAWEPLYVRGSSAERGIAG